MTDRGNRNIKDASGNIASPESRRVAQLPAFFAASIFLHALLLNVISWVYVEIVPPPRSPQMDVRLRMERIPAEAPRASGSAPRHRTHQPTDGRMNTSDGQTLSRKRELTATYSKAPDIENNVPIPPTAGVAANGGQRIDLDAAFATARSFVRSTEPKKPLESQTKRGQTVDSAISRAAVARVFVESRGPNNEWVYRNGITTCVMPTQVPVFLSGVTIVPVCSVSD